ncbi:MAG: alpha/beta hydrolase [Burkholderiaceae bacterium]
MALLLALLISLASCGSDPQPNSSTGSDGSDGSNNTADEVANPAGPGPSDPQSPPIPPIPPVDAEPPPDAAIGATSILRVSDVQRIAYIDLAADFAAANPNATEAPSTVLLLHDFGGSSIQWRELSARLATRHRVVMMDLRGHGNSTRTGCCTSLSALQNDVITLLDALNIPRAHLVGSGGGGLLAQQLATAVPDRTSHLVLISADSAAADNSALQNLRAQSDNFGDANNSNATAGPGDTFLAAYNSPGSNLSLQANSAINQLQRVQRSTESTVWLSTLALLSDSSVSGALAQVTTPVMLLFGEADNLMGGPAAQRLATALHTEVLQSLPGVGRYLSIEDPAATSELILRFLSPRGSLHESSMVSETGRGEVDNLGDGLLQELLVREVTGEPACSVRWYQVEYQTVGASGESTNATAGVAVPYGDPAACTGERPVLLYAHGTSSDRNYNTISSAEVGTVITSTVASHGVIIVAPDYAGYGKSWLDYHPYLNARANAADMIDALRAAKTFIATLPDVTPGPLFISGYSQGGYVAMATHREIEQFHTDEFSLRGSFPMSGPYALDQAVTAVFEGRVSDGASQLLPFFTEGYQRAYGNVFLAPAEIFNPPYDQTAIGLFPGNTSAGDSITNGLLPANTVAAQGDPYLLRQDFVDNYLDNPQNPLRTAVEFNSLIYNWTPVAPMQMCGSNKDTVVPFASTLAAVDAFAQRGTNVRYWDFNRAATFDSGAFDRRYLTFRTLILFADNSEYHVAVAPFCSALARAFIFNNR